MAKGNTVKSIPNRHILARTSFLYQAATYLTLQAEVENTSAPKASGPTSSGNVLPHDEETTSRHSGLALQLASHLHAISLKGQARLSAELKRTMCKTCNSILIPGRTATHTLENKSKGKKKPWADVVLIECKLCGSQKRYPVGARRQRSKAQRAKMTSPESLVKGLEKVDNSTSSTDKPDTVPNTGDHVSA